MFDKLGYFDIESCDPPSLPRVCSRASSCRVLLSLARLQPRMKDVRGLRGRWMLNEGSEGFMEVTSAWV